MSFPISCLMFLRISSVLAFEFGAGEDDRPSRLCPLHKSPCARFVVTETTWVSFLNIVHVPSTENTLPLSSLRRLSFLLDTWLLILFQQLRSGPWSFEFSSSEQYEVLQTSSIVNKSSAHYIGQFLGQTKPTQSEAEQSPVILTAHSSHDHIWRHIACR